MYKFVVALLVFCVLKDAASCSCFRPSSASCGSDIAPCKVSCGGSCGGPFCTRTSYNVDYCSNGGDQFPVSSCFKSLNQDCGCSVITSSSCGINSYNTGSSCGCNSYNTGSSFGCDSYNKGSSCGGNSYNLGSSCGCNTYTTGSSCGCDSYNILVPSSCSCNSYNLGSSSDVPSSSCGCSSCSRGSSCGAPNIYFPEVVYPVACGFQSAYCGCNDGNPFYYGVCWER